jgi:hypothetical protein
MTRSGIAPEKGRAMFWIARLVEWNHQGPYICICPLVKLKWNEFAMSERASARARKVAGESARYGLVS